ncbi:MAG TPA: thioredoxin family protein, partial [Pirellulales bacterium]|nr:thioredoxin family protein [Pirellulales bacterium]
EIGIEQPPSTSAGQNVESPATAGNPPPAVSRGPQVARGNLNFVEGYRAGSIQAAAEAKPMLVFFTAQWCRYCHQMADEAFTHPQVVALSQRFVCVLIDADAEPDVCRQFQVSGFPTIQFLSPSGVPLERVVGKQPGHQLMMAMQSALQNVARRQNDSDPSPSLE